ncbi:MAG: KH domain-containing protein [Clostridiales bacterium]|nr:MAG: KH domain-containing protein [Clostridiales bacterium]
MEELLAFLAKSLVDRPEDVSVTKVDGENSVVYELRVNDSDMGKVIGKQGRIAKSIRTIIKSASSKEDKRVIVDIVQ